MDFGSIPFVARATPSAPPGGGLAISDSSRSGPSGFTNTLNFTPPAGMQAGDQLVMVGYWDSPLLESDVGAFTDRSPASWLGAPSARRLLISDPFATVPESVTLTFGTPGEPPTPSNGLHEYSVFAVSGGVSTGAVLNSGTGTTGSAAGARNHAYSTGADDSLVVGFIDWTGGGVTGSASSDADHEWDLKTGEGYNNGFARVLASAGSYNASLAPTGASSGSEYGWAEIGAA